MSVPGSVLRHLKEDRLRHLETTEGLSKTTINNINRKNSGRLTVAKTGTESRIVDSMHVNARLKKNTTMLNTNTLRLTDVSDGHLVLPLSGRLDEHELDMSSLTSSRINRPVTDEAAETFRITSDFNMVNGGVGTRSTSQGLNGDRIEEDIDRLIEVTHVGDRAGDVTVLTKVSCESLAGEFTGESLDDVRSIRVTHTVEETGLVKIGCLVLALCISEAIHNHLLTLESGMETNVSNVEEFGRKRLFGVFRERGSDGPDLFGGSGNTSGFKTANWLLLSNNFGSSHVSDLLGIDSS